MIFKSVPKIKMLPLNVFVLPRRICGGANDSIISPASGDVINSINKAIKETILCWNKQKSQKNN